MPEVSEIDKCRVKRKVAKMRKSRPQNQYGGFTTANKVYEKSEGKYVFIPGVREKADQLLK